MFEFDTHFINFNSNNSIKEFYKLLAFFLGENLSGLLILSSEVSDLSFVCPLKTLSGAFAFLYANLNLIRQFIKC